MPENGKFKFKIAFKGINYDYNKKDFYDNGFIKVFYAKDFNDLSDIVVSFINGENRFINIEFDSENKTLKYTKRFADKEKINSELIAGLNFDLKQISDKMYFVLTSNGVLHWWDRVGYEGVPNTLFDFCDTNENAEYIVSVRLVINKEENSYE